EPDLEIEQNNKVEIKQELKTHLTPQLTTELTSQLTPNFTQSVVSAVEKPLELLSVGNTPLWAMEEARCLLVKVAGLKVFIPASYISSIKNVTNLLKPSSKMPTWIYELVDEEDDDADAIQIINTQKLIFNGVKIRRIQPDSRTYVVLIDDGSWGLSCDAIGEVVSLKSEDITWRSENTKRRWLAGTSSGNGAVILNVNQIESALIR
ncbi:MAG: chemotaxis protein CheW, partial [Gammaproteobacteria bacterium]|nr:chemotaxis protein CheW [Gammaproteobacteria bacterium]